MKEAAIKFRTVDDYIASMPPQAKKMLQQLRSIIREAAPDAEEVISYNMPAYKLNGNLVYFAAYANHIGFYPMPSAIEAFKKEISVYKNAKGSVQFPIDELIPASLVTKIVKFRVKENLEKGYSKKKVKK